MRVDTSAQHLATDQNPRPLQGVLWTLQGSAFYSLLFIFPNLWGEGLSPYQLAWFRFVGGFVSLTPLMLYFVLSGQSARLLPTPGLLGWHALRAAFGALTFLCSIVAVLNIDQANASAITMTSGVFTVALAMLLLGERPNRLVLLAVMCVYCRNRWSQNIVVDVSTVVVVPLVSAYRCSLQESRCAPVHWPLLLPATGPVPHCPRRGELGDGS